MIKDYSFQKNEKIILNEKGKISQVSLNDILSIETEAGVSIINKINKQKIIVSKNLRVLENIYNLEEKYLIRINRNEIINCAYVKEISFSKKEMVLENNETHKISRNNCKKVKQVFYQKKS